MKTHSDYDGHRNYTPETEKTTIPEMIIYPVAGIVFLTYDTARKILTVPARGLEKLARGTIKSLGGFDGKDID